MFDINKGIPVPNPGGGVGRPAKYPFKDMALGESFFIPSNDQDKARCRVLAAAYQAYDGSGYVTTRAVTEDQVTGIRVWRIK